MKKNLKKGNTGVAFLVMLLVILLVLISLYIVIDKLQPQNDVNVADGSEFKISNLEEAKDLLEKYWYVELGQKCYLIDMKYKGAVALAQTVATGTKTKSDINSTDSYVDEATYLFAATFDSEDVDFYLYNDVQEVLNELFGPNSAMEKRTYLNCPISYFYIKEFDGFVNGEIGCGSGWTTFQDLQVYDFENFDEGVEVYASLTKRSYAGTDELVNSEVKRYKYTFKIQNVTCYLDSVEEI